MAIVGMAPWPPFKYALDFRMLLAFSLIHVGSTTANIVGCFVYCNMLTRWPACRLCLEHVCCCKPFTWPCRDDSVITVSVRVWARLVEALDAARTAKGVLGLMRVERVCSQFVTALRRTYHTSQQHRRNNRRDRGNCPPPNF